MTARDAGKMGMGGTVMMEQWQEDGGKGTGKRGRIENRSMSDPGHGTATAPPVCARACVRI